MQQIDCGFFDRKREMFVCLKGHGICMHYDKSKCSDVEYTIVREVIER